MMLEIILWVGGYFLGVIGSAYFFSRTMKMEPGVAVFEAFLWPIMLPILLPFLAAIKGRVG